jgi:hypothetical protein
MKLVEGGYSDRLLMSLNHLSAEAIEGFLTAPANGFPLHARPGCRAATFLERGTSFRAASASPCEPDGAGASSADRGAPAEREQAPDPVANC